MLWPLSTLLVLIGHDCPDRETDLAPFHGGSTMFIYQAVSGFETWP